MTPPSPPSPYSSSLNRFLPHAALAAGLVLLVWLGVGYAGRHLLALAVTALIGAFYLMGAFELRRFQQATDALDAALLELNGAPVDLASWLGRLPASIREAVRGRIEGERSGLSGPLMTPYLTGLLVLLGMLGTFLGMVLTLQGTGLALDSATDLEAVRASLSAPVKGLGLAFGTSVAGVAASAMLGLASAWCRRARLLAARRLDQAIAGSLRIHSPAHRREASFLLLQRQAEAMPALADRLQALAQSIEQRSVTLGDAIERRSEALASVLEQRSDALGEVLERRSQLLGDAIERRAEALGQSLVAGQAQFHEHAEAAYRGLAVSIDRSLQQSFADSARAAAETMQPLAQATMSGIARETSALHARVADAAQLQLEGLSSRFELATCEVAGIWAGALEAHRDTGAAQQAQLGETLSRFSEGFASQSAALLAGVEHAHAGLQADLAAREQERLAASSQALERMAAALQQEWRAAGEAAALRQQQLGDALAERLHEMAERSAAQSAEAIAETSRLLQAAAEAPRAAAEVIGELRQKLSDSMARDNAMLEERGRILQTLTGLLDAAEQGAHAQRGAIDQLVGSAGKMLARSGERFAEQAEAGSGRIESCAAQLAAGAVEVASLGEAFGFAVQRFGESNERLIAQLDRVEAALSQSSARSDEQLAYYVAQAREVIDLSITSQRQVVEDLQALGGRRVAEGSAA